MSPILATSPLHLKLHKPISLSHTNISSSHPIPFLRRYRQRILTNPYIRIHILPIDPCTVRLQGYFAVHQLRQVWRCGTWCVAEFTTVEGLVTVFIEYEGE